jgi:alpha-beta hydrolase superfamily lysophospholipase
MHVRTLLLLALLLGPGCTPQTYPAGPPIAPPRLAEDALLMPDGARLPLTTWPAERPRAILLGLHGFNDAGRPFMEDIAPQLNGAGITVYAYDQRGFGRAPHRGFWPGAETLVADAGTAARLLAARHPGLPLYLLGESMGGAVAILAGTADPTPPIAGYILAAPALRGGEAFGPTARWLLRLLTHTIPAVGVFASTPGIASTDNQAALRRMARDPLIIHATRIDAGAGLLELMDRTLLALPACCRSAARPGPAPVLVLVGRTASCRMMPAAERCAWRMPKTGCASPITPRATTCCCGTCSAAASPPTPWPGWPIRRRPCPPAPISPAEAGWRSQPPANSIPRNHRRGPRHADQHHPRLHHRPRNSGQHRPLGRGFPWRPARHGLRPPAGDPDRRGRLPRADP